MDIDDIQLPAGTHATVLTGTDIVTGGPLAYPVIWADRPYNSCPNCGQPVAVETDCPVTLNTGACQGGRLEELDQQHRCGEWLSVAWQEVDAAAGAELRDGDVTPGVRSAFVIAMAAGLAADRQENIAAGRRQIEAGLRDDLAAALARLAEPFDPDETAEDRAEQVTTGSETEPGVYCEDGQWLAWAYDPLGTEPISVYASDLIQETHTALTAQLREEVGGVASALDALLGERTADRVHAHAPMWAANLLGGDDKLAAQTVIDIMNVLTTDDLPAEWWATPLGRAVARSVGHPTADVVSYSVAGAMLGCTKQAVNKMVKAGRLLAGADSGVTVASVQAILRRAEQHAAQ